MILNDFLIFDLSTLATIIRHCSILGCWLLRNPCSERIEPVKRILKQFNLNIFKIDEYVNLYKYKLYMNQQVDKRYIEGIRATPKEWIEHTKTIVNTVKGIVNEQKTHY